MCFVSRLWQGRPRAFCSDCRVFREGQKDEFNNLLRQTNEAFAAETGAKVELRDSSMRPMRNSWILLGRRLNWKIIFKRELRGSLQRSKKRLSSGDASIQPLKAQTCSNKHLQIVGKLSWMPNRKEFISWKLCRSQQKSPPTSFKLITKRRLKATAGSCC